MKKKGGKEESEGKNMSFYQENSLFNGTGSKMMAPQSHPFFH